MEKIKIHKISEADKVTLLKFNEVINTVNDLTQVVADLIKEHGSKKYAVDDIYELETDENGHDLQCSSGVGGRCDCWKKEETPQWLENHCPKCSCLYDDKMKGAQGRNGACECSCGHKSPKAIGGKGNGK